jgi:replicative DNA helicase
MKNLAKELNIPVIALSQLNRNVDIRTSQFRSKNNDNYDAKRPQLSDLRESGAIEQDADIVCFIHRPEYYKIFQDERGNDLTGKAEIIIAKHRNGSTGDVILEFKKEFARFQNLDENRILTDFQSRVSSQVDLIPEERSGARKMATHWSNNVPF